MEDIIAAIDQAVGCQQCGKTLERSVSDDFCGEGCQQAWHAKRTGVSRDSATLADLPWHLLQECHVLPLAPMPDFQEGDRMTVRGLPGPEHVYTLRQGQWTRTDEANATAGPQARFDAPIQLQQGGVNTDIRGWIEPERWDAISHPAAGPSAQFEAMIRVTADRAAQACGIPPELLGYEEPTCAEVVRNAVHIRGNGTHYIPGAES